MPGAPGCPGGIGGPGACGPGPGPESGATGGAAVVVAMSAVGAWGADEGAGATVTPDAAGLGPSDFFALQAAIASGAPTTTASTTRQRFRM